MRPPRPSAATVAVTVSPDSSCRRLVASGACAAATTPKPGFDSRRVAHGPCPSSMVRPRSRHVVCVRLGASRENNPMQSPVSFLSCCWCTLPRLGNPLSDHTGDKLKLHTDSLGGTGVRVLRRT